MKIVVLSKGAYLYSTQRLIEAGKDRQHKMSVLDYQRCHLIVDKEKSGIYNLVKPIKDIEAVIPRIGASLTFQGAAAIRAIETQGILSCLSSDALLKARDKLGSLQLLSAAGIRVPGTIYADYTYAGNMFNYITKLGGFPIIIKTLEGTHGEGVVLAKNQAAAFSIIRSFARLQKKFVLQEYIEESSGSDIRAFVIGKKVVASMMRQAAAGDFRANLHQGGTASPVLLTQEEEEMAIKSATLLGLNIAGVDILRSNRGPLVLEINSSPGLEGIEKTTGIDIAGKIIDYVASLVQNKRNHITSC